MLLSRLRRRADRDGGSALIAVIALLGVTAIIAAMIGAVSVGSLATSSAVAASVQARAAAEAGVNAAEMALRTAGGCPAGGLLTQVGPPAYSVQVQYRTDDGPWIDGCPPNSATEIRFLSTGGSDRESLSASELGERRVMEARYPYVKRTVTIPNDYVALYAHTVIGEMKTFKVLSANKTEPADLLIQSGNLTCTNNGVVEGQVIVVRGFASLTNCGVAGSVFADTYVSINQATNDKDFLARHGAVSVKENVFAAGTGVATTANTVTGSSAVIGKGIYAGGNVGLSLSRVGGDVVSSVVPRTDATGVTLNGSTIGGSVLSSGYVSPANPPGVTGIVAQGLSGLPQFPRPSAPTWTDIPWNLATLPLADTTWGKSGFTLAADRWTGTCSFTGSLDRRVPADQQRWVNLSTYTTPTVVDATGCDGGVVTQSALSYVLSLKTDVAIMADSFNLGALKVVSNDATKLRKLYLIVPDNTANSQPTCVAPGDIRLNIESDMSPTISAFVYTPCRLTSDRNNWRGQFYGGEVSFTAQAQLTYARTAPPGVGFEFNTPETVVVVGADLGIRQSLREVSALE